ncbi:MAG: hypothetical protein R2911_18875 [Caldilineaceae bacterium]
MNSPRAAAKLRAENALHQVADMIVGQESALIIHMGDLIQEFPERPNFAQARDEALAQLARHLMARHNVGRACGRQPRRGR